MTDTASAVVEPDYAKHGKALCELLRSADIGRMVVVDDRFADNGGEPSDETLIAAVLTKTSEYFAYVDGLADVPEGDPDLSRDLVRRVLEDVEARAKLTGRFASLFGPPDSDPQADKAAMSVLRQLKKAVDQAAGPKLLLLSAAAWDAQKPSHTAGANVLLVADLDFTGEGRGKTHGLQLLADPGNSACAIYRALLTHTIGVGEELGRQSELAGQGGENTDGFVVIAKARLAAEKPDLSGFLHLLRLAILSAPIRKLKEEVSSQLEQAGKVVAEALKQWNVYDFDSAVFGSSRREGVWEGETLLRIVAHLVASQIREKIRGDGGIRAEIELARKASMVTIAGGRHGLEGAGRQALAYQWSELYQDAASVNGHHLPLEVGDLFALDDGEERFVLLAQPCDLMVRKEGKRTRDEKYARLLPLCAIKPTAPGERGHSHELEWWDPETGDSAYVHFADVHLVRAAILDLTVLSESGEARYSGASTNALPAHLSPAWGSHASGLMKHFKSATARATRVVVALDNPKVQLNKTDREAATQSLAPFCSNTGKFRVTLDGEGFSVNLRRVGRVAPGLAADVLRAFSRYQSRSAFEQAVVDPSDLPGVGDATAPGIGDDDS